MAPPRKRATLREIAERTGLSTAAVSYALRGERVAPATIERVREVAEEIGYQADPVARALRGGPTGTVAILAGSLADFWQQTLVHGLQRELRRHGLLAFVADADGDPARALDLAERLVDQRVDGLLVSPVGPAGGPWAEIADRIPVVTIGGRFVGAAVAGEVAFDTAAGGGEVLRHLHTLGHRRIVALSWALSAVPDRPGEAAIAEQASALGIDLAVLPCAYSLDGSQPLALEVLDADDRPTAILCMSDSIAYGVLLACRQLGVRVPDDLSLVGFDDHPVSRLLDPPLTSVHWSVERSARTAVSFLVEQLEDGAADRRLVIPPRLEVRASTGPAISAPRTD